MACVLAPSVSVRKPGCEPSLSACKSCCSLPCLPLSTRFPTEGVEGKDFFADCALIEAVLQVIEGTPSEVFSGVLSQDEACRMLRQEFFVGVAFQKLVPVWDIDLEGELDDEISMYLKTEDDIDR